MNVQKAMARALITPLAVLGVAAIAPTSASAATTTNSLQGEFLSSLPPAQTTGGNCDPTTESTLEFSATGVATGPYPGTFTETGSATFSPSIYANPTAPGQFRAQVLAFSADFTITGAFGTVTGHKELAPGGEFPIDAGNAAACNAAGSGIAGIATFNLVYTAHTPTGDDSGTSAVDMNTYPVPDPNSTSKQFREFFYSLNPTITPQCSDNVDNDGDGLIDYPADPGCTSPADDSESPNPPPPTTQCSDGVDNDGDGLIDFASDPGCTSLTDNSEAPNPPASVVVNPPTATNPVGTSHTVTATVKDVTGAPLSGVGVLVSVAGSTTSNGSCATNASGQCAYTYPGPSLPGANSIKACADSNANGVADVGEPCGTATKTWVIPATTYGQVTGVGLIANATHTGYIAFALTVKSDRKGVKGDCFVLDLSASTTVRCLDVTALVVTGNNATFFGHATVNGVATTYRIDVVDNGPSGHTDTFAIQTGTGYTAGGVLTAGDIQVH